MKSSLVASVVEVELPDFDLTTIKIRAMGKHTDWYENRLNLAESEYRRFLALCKTYPKSKICPSRDVDEIWHLHILDTAKYAEDCASYLGYFLHHEACIGTVDVESVLQTVILYTKTFGVEPGKEWRDSVTMTCANPGGGCGSIPV